MSGMTLAYARNSKSQLSVGKRIVLPLVRREARKRNRSDVVEVGCGPGTLLAALAPMIAAKPLGLDRDAVGVTQAKEAGLRARRVDFRSIPTGLKGKFGVAFSNEALHWTPAPPARFRRAAWFYRFLPIADRASFDRWGEVRFAEGLRGVAQLLESNGAAVLQFGGHGQIQALFESFDWALAHPRFNRYRGRLWYPTYYPNQRSLPGLLARAGLKAVRVRVWSEPLAERSPAETVAFVRAFTKRTFLGAMRSQDREFFYERLAARLRETGLRSVRWQRTLIVARRS